MQEKKAKKYSILSIEDDQLYADFLQKLVVMYIKADFHHCSNPNDALDWLIDNTPDLILLDLELPKMDGLKTLQFIRIQLDKKDIKVIPCTTLANKDLIANLASKGISDYIVKTTPSKIIAQKIQAVLENNGNKK